MRRLSSDEIKQVELNVLVELDRICKQQGLRYYLAFGTLIGALRHGGFIPWDDDIDVLMPRCDYETLLENFAQWRSEEKFGIAVYRDGVSTFQYAKMVDMTTCATENYVSEQYKVGLWVDLFPLDERPRYMRFYTIVYMLIGLLRELRVGNRHQGTTALRRIVKSVAYPLVKRVSVTQISGWMDNLARYAYKGRHTDRYWDVMASGGKKYRDYLKSSFEPAREVDFAGVRCRIPRQSELLLEIAFGDWRTIPPEDERPTHMVDAFLLDDGELPSRD